MAAVAETDLARTLRQIIELRNVKNSPGSDTITLFGKKLSVSSVPDASLGDMKSSDKLPPAAIAHLKELYTQHLKRRAPSTTTVRPQNGHIEKVVQATLPLLDRKDNKRQRVSLDSFCVPGTGPIRASGAPVPEETPAQAQPVFQEIDPSMDKASASEVAKGNPLTLFYDGKVYVYDDISEDMARAIMVLAGKSSAQEEKNGIARRTFTVADLPQARKASLKSFLEKRKHRLFIKNDKQVFIKSTSPVSSRSSTPLKADPCGKVFGEKGVEGEAQMLQIH